METYEFTIIATGLHFNDASFEDRFYEAGCDDATLAFQKGVIILQFDREAKSFGRALFSAIDAVHSVGAIVIHVEPDHLVSISDIAARAGLTRAAISNYANGERAKAFPTPVARVMTDSPLWNWIEVARWFHKRGVLSWQALLRARIIEEANIYLFLKRQGHFNDTLWSVNSVFALRKIWRSFPATVRSGSIAFEASAVAGIAA